MLISTLPQNYETAWFFEDEKEATRTWRSYTGVPWMSKDELMHKEKVIKFVEISHATKHCFSGVSSLCLTYPGEEPGDFVEGGTATDCEIEEDRLFIFSARVYHEWYPHKYRLETKKVLRIEEDGDVQPFSFEENMRKFYNNIDPSLVALFEAEREDRMGQLDEDGGTVVDVSMQMPENMDDPVIMTTVKE